MQGHTECFVASRDLNLSLQSASPRTLCHAGKEFYCYHQERCLSAFCFSLQNILSKPRSVGILVIAHFRCTASKIDQFSTRVKKVRELFFEYQSLMGNSQKRLEFARLPIDVIAWPRAIR